jgi:hypothetical protein
MNQWYLINELRRFLFFFPTIVSSLGPSKRCLDPKEYGINSALNIYIYIYIYFLKEMTFSLLPLCRKEFSTLFINKQKTKRTIKTRENFNLPP